MKLALHRIPLVALLLSISAPALAGDRSNFDASWSAPRVAATRMVTRGAAPAGWITSTDARTAAPSFLWAARRPLGSAPLGPTPELAARAFLQQQAPRYGIAREAVQTARAVRVHDTGRGGIVVAFRQQIDGVEIFHGDTKVLLRRDLSPVAVSGALHRAAAGRPRQSTFALPQRSAIAAALSDLYEVTLAGAEVVDLHKQHGDFDYFDVAPSSALSKAGVALVRPVRVKKVFFPLPDRVVPAWFLEVLGERTGAGPDAFAYVISAVDGQMLYRENLTHDDAFQYRVWADTTGNMRPTDGPMADYSPYPAAAPDGSYPEFIAPVLVSMEGFNTNPSMTIDPWLPAGATETRGNNADAYTDDESPDGFSAGDLRATVTSPGVFDRVYELGASPLASDHQKMASVTQLFYVGNWQHDWWYDSGFDEAAGNAQDSNYGRGGLGNDAMLLQAQDGAPVQRNNANMSVFADGESPRMQVFVWDGPSSSSVSVLPLAQNLPHGLAEFGPANFDMSGAVVLADDGDATPTDACAALVGPVAGQIALVDRGSCTFKQKAVNVQAAGAVGMILANHTANEPPPFMPDASPAVAVTIPCVSITLGDGASLKASLSAGATSAALSRSSAADRDGALDNTTVAHEWGHFLHLRQVACGAAICSAQSEGWADFVALLMMVEEGDDLGGAFPISQYATAGFPDDPAYFGIRRYPYSADFQKNPLTFRHIQSGEPLPTTAPVAPSGLFNDNAEVHAAGEIWASMLFEGYVSLLEQTKLATPPYTFEQARRRMADYVQAALVLAPPEPSYLEQRDALLAAAYAADESDFQLLAEAFARRGAGTCAVAPPKESQDFNGVVESFDLRASATIVRASIDDDVSSCDDDGVLDAAERGTVTVELMNGGTSPLIGAKASIQSGSGDLEILEGKEIQLPLIEPLATFVATFEVALAESAKAKQKVEVVVTVDSPEGCTESAEIVLAPRTNLDEAAASSSVDDVETSTSAWKPKGSESDAIWSIEEEEPGEHVWRGRGHGSPSDTALISPELEVSDSEPLVITFSHRHQFEASDGVYWDGGVIEVSVDNGQSWTDVSDFVDPGYGEIIGDPDDGAKNVLKDRAGFVAQNASWPEPDAVTLDFGSAFAGKTLRIRFRIGTDDAVGAHGWELDDLGFSGIDNTPFASLVPDGTTCASEGLPHADAGADLVVRSGEMVSLDGSKSSDPDEQPLEFAWKQTLGVVAALEGVESANASFIAPRTATPMHLSFQLTVTDGQTAISDTIDVLVNPDDSYRDGGPYQPGGGCGCGVGRIGTAPGLALSAALALLGLSRRRRRPRQPE